MTPSRISAVAIALSIAFGFFGGAGSTQWVIVETGGAQRDSTPGISHLM